MEMWTLVFWLTMTQRPIHLDMQGEDPCTIVAKDLTSTIADTAICVNGLDGVVLYFKNGKQVERSPAP